MLLHNETCCVISEHGQTFTLRRVGWMIRSGRVSLPFTVKETRTEAINNYVYNHIGEAMCDWRKGQREGWLSCVPVYEDLSQ